jgi:hypothetical protein
MKCPRRIVFVRGAQGTGMGVVRLKMPANIQKTCSECKEPRVG